MIIELAFDEEGDRVGKLHDNWDRFPQTQPPVYR
jgi:hypothetical protein